MKKLFFLFLFIPSILFSQTDTSKGIHFEQGLSWDQIKAKAKAENKYIFVDCYATWCGPCKLMDKEVYSQEKVGNYLDATFISVKIQMDSSKQDNDHIKKWYTDASYIQQQYNVTNFPTYLFFLPDGKIVHKNVGYKDADEFITVVKNSNDPKKQYYTLLESYQQGKKDYSLMPYLAITAKSLNEIDIANVVAHDYKDNFLNKLELDLLCSKNNLDFIGQFPKLISSHDKIFDLFYHYAIKVDELRGIKGYSQKMTDYIITKEEINHKLYFDNNPENPIVKKPNWSKISGTIRKKYGSSYADRTILNAQIRWSYSKKDWPQIAEYNIEKIEKYGLDTSGMGKYFLNNMIWEVVFLHSDDLYVLNKGITWIEALMRMNPTDINVIDTYANLIYKAGRAIEAIKWEEKAVEIAEENAVKSSTLSDKGYKETLEKMRKGEKTWTQNN